LPTPRRALPSRLYAIVDASVAARAGWDVVDLAVRCLDSGVRLLQLRAKDASGRDVLRWTDAMAARLSDRPDVLFITNDRVDVAIAAGVPNVHVGQDDLAPGDARALVGPLGVVGLSTHTSSQVAAACALPIDYLAVGPVFETGTKDTGYEAVGLAMVRQAAALTAQQPPALPIVAIGGITIDRSAEVIDAGAAAVAVIGGLLGEGDPSAAVRRYLRALGEG
jgi:thiamine-phosphate pyrophosphorylase